MYLGHPDSVPSPAPTSEGAQYQTKVRGFDMGNAPLSLAKRHLWSKRKYYYK